MNVGDIRRETPSVDSTVMLEDRQPWRCEVVYIHPKWRFYTVEFTTVLGWKFRESFFFRDKRLDGPELPEEIRKQREAQNAHWRVRQTRPRFDYLMGPLPIYSR